MSLGQPNLYIGGQLMQSAKGDPRPALAGLRLSWGNDSRVEMDPPAKLSGQILVKGAMPAFLEVGAPVGLVDPVSARCLFAGTLEPLKAVPDESVRGAMRVQFNASSPLSELGKHRVLDIAWPDNQPAANRFGALAWELPRGWALTGSTGYTWINQARQVYQSIEWLTLAERFCRGYMYRYHDTSYYTPGAGLFKRLTFSPDRDKAMPQIAPPAGTSGVWATGPNEKPQAASGIAVLPETAIRRGIEWEKTPEDMITQVQLVGYTVYESGPEESDEFEFPMHLAPFNVDNTAAQDAYGFRQLRLEMSLTAADGALGTAGANLVNYWLDAQNKWRPTSLQIPDSRRLDTAPLLNMLAVDTRGTAAVLVRTDTVQPGQIVSFVMAGDATWTGKKWITDLTLGRTL